MNKNILLIVLAGVFLLMFDAYVSSELEQASYVDIPPIESVRESREEQQNETQLSHSSLYSDERAFAEDLADDETDGSANDENNEEKEAQEPFAFSSNPSSDYYAMNSDYVGWIEVAGTRIDYPVVRGQDNEFYLEHDFYKEEHILGSIFMDYRNVGMGMDDHTILYGHYTKTGLMFADLDKYLSEEFTQNNSTIVFNDPFTDRTYEIFSVHVAPADSEYIRTSFQDDELEAYYEKLKASSNFPIESEFQEDQKMLTLISCNYTVDDGRVYVHAYEVTE